MVPRFTEVSDQVGCPDMGIGQERDRYFFVLQLRLRKVHLDTVLFGPVVVFRFAHGGKGQQAGIPATGDPTTEATPYVQIVYV